MSDNITDPVEKLYEFCGSKFYDLRKIAKDIIDSHPEPGLLSTDQIRLLVDMALVELAETSAEEIARSQAVITPSGQIKHRHLRAVKEVAR